MTTPLWKPSQARISETALSQFASWLSARAGRPFTSYEDLHRYSVQDIGEFWSAFWDFAGVVGEKGEAPYLINEGKMPGAQFFPAARLNYAENVLRASGPGDAIVFWGEDKVKRRLSWDELHSQAGKVSSFL